MDFRPDWLDEFVNSAGTALLATEDLTPLGCHYAYADGVYEITLFLSGTEYVGGDRDGQIVPCQFVLDITKLLHLFDRIEGISWQPFPIDAEDDLKNHVSISGDFREHEVWLRVLSQSPDGFEAGRIVGLENDAATDLWFDPEA